MTSLTRPGLVVLVTLLLGTAGCGGASGGPPPAAGSPRVDTVAITANPSFPPVAGVISTGSRRGDEELLIWLGRFSPTSVGLDSTWYHHRTGATRNTEAINGWSGDAARGFRQIQVIDLGDGRIAEYGFLVGPAARVDVAQSGRTTTAAVRRWPADPSVVVFWIDREGAAGHWETPLPEAQRPVYTAYDQAGSALFRQRLDPPVYVPRNDG